jgi:uncharacterized protein YhdP
MRRRLLRAVRVVALVAVVASATAALWLARHPVDLAFLKPQIEAAASTDRYTVALERAALVWDWRRGPEFRVSGARVTSAEGVELARLPEVSLAFSLGELLRGRIALTGVTVDAPAARLVRRADGSVDVGLRGSAATPGSGPDLPSPLLDRLAAEPDPDARLGRLERVRIRGADLELEDLALGIRWRAPRADIEVWRRPEGLAGSLEAELDVDGVRGEAGADFAWGREDREASVSARVANLDVRPILRTLLAEASLPSLPLSGWIESRWLPGESPLPVESRFELAAADSAALAGLELTGSLREGTSAPHLDVALRLERFDVARLADYWPAGLGDAARSWVLANVPSGRVDAGRLALGLRLRRDPVRVELAKLHGSFGADRLPVHYLAPLPEARDVKARVRFDRDRWDFEILEGRVRDVELGSGRVAIGGISARETRLEVDVRLAASLSSLLEILALPPLGIVLPGSDPQQVQGHADVRLELDLPLSGRLEKSDIAFEAEADVRDAAIRHEIGLALTGCALHLETTLHELRAEGEGRLQSVPARFAWKEVFRGEDGLHHFDVRGELTPEDTLRPPARFEVTAASEGPSWRAVLAVVRSGESGVSHVRYAAPGPARTVAADSSDLGSLLAALGFSLPLRGGTLTLDAGAPAPGAPLSGSFELAAFTLGETPLLSRLLDALSLTRIRSALVSKGLVWDQARGGLVLGDGWLELREGRAVGRSLVVTSDGRLDLESLALDTRGMIAPLDELDSLVRKVPVVGRLLTGADEAVVAAHYGATGRIDDPRIRVDPWTTLVPGPVRELVGAGRRLRPAARPGPAGGR